MNLQTMVTLLGSNNNEVDDLASIALSNSNELADAVSAYSDILSDEVDTNILPKFEAGMRNIRCCSK